MPSTYDPLLRLELQATGENATTWGIKTNTNLDLLAESIAGAVTLNVAGSGDFTLSTASGAEDEARYAILVLTGLLTGDRNIIVPSSPKNYTVINQTTGAFTVTLKQSAGTGVVVPQGSPSITVCTSTTCVDSIGATPYTKNFLAATSVTPAVSALGLANTATLVATSIGSALITAVDTSAGRAAIDAVGTGLITTSGLTQNTSRLLGRTTAGIGAVEEITIGAGLSFTGGTLTAPAAASLQVQEQVFTASGSWTAPTGVTRVRVVVVGGGAGGAGGGVGCCPSPGGIGGSGGLAVGNFSVTPGTSYTVTVGGAGTGGAINAFGTSGGTSSFDSFASATGGTGSSHGSGSGGTIRNSNVVSFGAAPFSGTVRTAAGTAGVAFAISSLPGAGTGGAGGAASTAGSGGVGGVVYLQWIGA
jgi:hypothetical protein